MTDLKKLRKLAVAIRKTDFESEDFNDTLLIDHVVATGGTMHVAFEMTKPLRDFIAACSPQAIIELLDRLERYEKALRFYGNEKNWDDSFLLSMSDREPTTIHDECGGRRAREALEGGK